VPSAERRSETLLGPDELIVSVRLPGAAGRSGYLKAMDRKLWAFALVGVAAAARVDDGRIADARLVLSGVAPTPWRVPAAERALIGRAPDDRLFDDAAELALAGARPLRQNGYKVMLARTLVRRALAAVTGT
jgi:xanthine dehydrogenase YagS FAD-binding subunit